jgi:hypothetical protein
MADTSFLNNPAGRLYALLSQLKMQQQGSIKEAWSQILGVSQDRVSRHMSEVARLVWELDRVVSNDDMELVAAPFQRHKPVLLEAAFPMVRGFDEPVGNIIPPEEAYENLGLLAKYLATAAPEGPIPSDEERADLLERLQELIDEVAADEELPDNVMRLVLERLRAVRDALDNIRVGGPGSVQRATETLLGAAFASSVMNEKAKKSKSLGRVVAVVGAIWLAFTTGPNVQKSLDAWTAVYDDLSSGQAQIQPPAQDQTPRPHDEQKPSEGKGKAPQ